ncbi:MAG: sulfatase-like hydrolase/transferase, partial [Verrucomicrobiota bacterium]
IKGSTSEQKPFFCYLAYNTPHSPYRATDALFDKYKAKGLSDEVSAKYAMVESIDENIGRLRSFLDEQSLTNDTIIIFLSDNGPAMHKSKRFNGHFYKTKSSVHEGGVRVPCFVAWPGTIPAGTRFDKITSHIDWFPTLAELCGLEAVKEQLPIDGASLAEVLRTGGNPARWMNRLHFSVWTPPYYDLENAALAVRTDRWLAVKDKRAVRDEEVYDRYLGWELYDLQIDPFQNYDVGADFIHLLGDMASDMGHWLAQVSDDVIGRIPIEIGHSEWPRVHLRSQDADRSEAWKINKYGNHSWAIEWPEAGHIEWPVKVIDSRSYQVTAEYGIAANDLPCSLIFETSEGKLIAQLPLTSATEMTVTESPHERYPARSYPVTDGTTQPIGTITLPADLTGLRLRLDKPAASFGLGGIHIE